MSVLHELRLYWMDNGVPYLVQEYTSKDEKGLIACAEDRKANNPDYAAVLITYNVVDAKII